MTSTNDKLALFGGNPSVTLDQTAMFKWPRFSDEHEAAVLDVLRNGNMSGFDVTKKFEQQYADNLGRAYALCCPNGTAAILNAFYAMGVGVGDEVIAPTLTYWASILQVYNLGATPVFADVDPDTLCIDPHDIEHRINDRTKAIVVVHYSGMPADVDSVKNVAAKYGIPIIEDCSHAHGALYKGREVGSLTEVSAFSLMSGKSFAIGEAGIFFTDNREIFDRGLLFSHYARHKEIKTKALQTGAGLPAGGFKHRLNQLTSALGLVHLRHYPKQMQEIDKAMNYFCDLIEDLPGIELIRPLKGSKTTKGGWYFPLMKYNKAKLGGLSLQTFAKAIRAEGSVCNPGSNTPLHLHPLFTEMDVYGHGKPTRFAHLPEDIDKSRFLGSYPVAEKVYQSVFQVPWFKQFDAAIIEEHAAAYKKVVENSASLLKDDDGDDSAIGGFSTFFAESRDNRS